MVFSSEVFLFVFLPIVLFLYYGVFLHLPKVKNIYLLFVSLFFYAWGEPKYVYLMIAVIFVSWLGGMLVGYFETEKKKARIVMAVTIVIDLAALVYFKYTMFVLSNVKQLFGAGFSVPQIALPIGISFFTFQAVSYVVDIYREEGEMQSNPFNVGLYIALFPQLIAGPIVRYQTFAEQIEVREEGFYNFGRGACRFMIGLAKKVVISNNVGIVATAAFDLVSGGTYRASVMMAWVGAICYSFQIFFDFAGYSDMAIGLGHMFGFQFEENFRYPYISRSITEFWRRWHISLQTWFRDYVYIPLGGSKVKTKGRLVFNLFVVWMLTGIWHGAAWTFFLWGFLYFVLLTVEKLTGMPEKVGTWGRFYTLFFVIIGWVIFRSESLRGMLVYLGAMFGRAAGGLWDAGALAYLNQSKFYLIAAVICSTPIITIYDRRMRRRLWWSAGYVAVLTGIFLVTITFIFNQSYNPFIYFNF